MISLLINTYDRYENIHHILKTQCDYKIISEVLVFNNGPNPIELRHKKLKVISANYDVGLRSRWILGALATNSCLFVQDDDLLVQESVFDVIHGNYMFDYDKLYGVFGRKIDALGGYSLEQGFLGEVDVILTRFACFDKSLIPYLLEAEDRILTERYPKAKDFPYDDILLNYTCKSLYGKKSYAVKIDDFDKLVTELPDTNGLHLDSSYMEKRKEVISTCRRILVGENIKYPVTATAGS